MEEKKFVVFQYYFTDIGDDKAYYNENDLDKTGFGCNHKNCTLYTEQEAIQLCLKQNEIYETSNGCVWDYELFTKGISRWEK